MIDLGKQWQTRDGRRVRALQTFRGERETLFGFIVLANGVEKPGFWYSDGNYIAAGFERDEDLVEVPIVTKTYQSEYSDAPCPNVREEGKTYTTSRAAEEVVGHTVRTYRNGILHNVEFIRR